MSYLRSRFLLQKFRTEGFEPEETTARLGHSHFNA